MLRKIQQAKTFYKAVYQNKGYFPNKLLMWQVIGKFSPALIPIIGKKNVQRICDYRHHLTRSFLEENFSDFIDSFEFNESISFGGGVKYVWTMWLQGYEQAPIMVQRTIDSIKDFAKRNQLEFILLTEDNLSDYCLLPEHILDKYHQKFISPTHLSDISRFCLLSTKGGIWLDSTVYVSQNIDATVFDQPFFSIKTGKYEDYSPSVTKNRWKTFAMSGYHQTPLFTFVRDFLFEYFEKYNQAVDYLLIDYLMDIASRKDEKTRQLMDNITMNNQSFTFLADHLFDPYDEKEWQNILVRTQLFKTTYKIEVISQPNSYYEKLINKKL